MVTTISFLCLALSVTLFGAAAIIDLPLRNKLPAERNRAFGNWYCSMGFWLLSPSFLLGM